VAAISSPLIESSIQGAKGVVLNITGGNDLTLHEVNTVAETIYDIVDPNANIIFGAVIDESMQGEIRITAIATGFSAENVSDDSLQNIISPSTPPSIPLASSNKDEDEEEKPVDSESETNSLAGLDIPEFLQRRRFPRR